MIFAQSSMELGTTVGLTHAESVNAPERFRIAGVPMLTLSSTPSNVSPLLSIPVTHGLAGKAVNVPLLPLPDESAALVPLLSFSFHQPTGSAPATLTVGGEHLICLY